MKERTLVSLSREVIDDIKRLNKEENFNFSGWVEDMYVQHKMSEKALKLTQKHYEKMAEKYKNRCKYYSKKRLKLGEKLKNVHKKQLLASIEIIKKKGEFFKGQLNLWNSKFPDFKLTALEFKELLGLGDLKK